MTLAPGRYQINVYQYWDEAQDGNPISNVESEIVVSVFAKSSGKLLFKEILSLADIVEIPYTNVECSIDELKTARVKWSTTVLWKPADFADAEGYMIVWERCCRSAAIDNIVAPDEAGAKFTLDIPPLWKDGKVFINSSPGLNRPLGDYACVNALYYIDFSASDPDGDSLSYRLVTPLNSSSLDAYPESTFGRDLKVRWKSGFSESNAIRGTPPLAVSSSGRLTVKPKESGLHAFSLEIREWREINGVMQQIGLAQRDFQLLVIDDCDSPPPPKLSVIVPENPGFDPATDVLTYAVEDDKCFQFLVENVNEGDTIKFKANPVNFDGDYEFFDDARLGIGADKKLTVNYCAPDCPPLRGRPFVVDFMVMLDVCPLPQFDTVRMSIQVEPPFNEIVELDPIQDAYVINEEDSIFIPFVATDADGDSIQVDIFIDDTLTLKERGMFYEVISSTPGRLEGVFKWKTHCQVYDFSDRQTFKLGIQVEDVDSCEYADPAIEWVDLEVILPGNTDPELIAEVADTITLSFDEALAFDLAASDADADSVLLRIVGVGFDPFEVGAQFQDQKGLAQVTSSFEWKPQCRTLNLLERNEFLFHFVAEDVDKCKVKNHDTVSVFVRIPLPENNAPMFDKGSRYFQLEVNEPFDLNITASDVDQDEITVSLVQNQFIPSGFLFNEGTAVGEISSTLSWTPSCNFVSGNKEPYNIVLQVVDNACPIIALDTFSIYLEVIETLDVFEGFDPPNAFTPNGDDKNETFSCFGHLDPKRNLPPDRCLNLFQSINIYNRSGKQVFSSPNRDFSWDGNGHPTGTYYYHIQFTNSDFKGIIYIMR